MNPALLTKSAAILLLGHFAPLAAAAPAVQRAEPLPLSTSYWRDPAFLKSFNASYRIEARIEPNVTSDERALLVEIQELMANDQRAEAIRRLENHRLTSESAALTYNLANIRFEEGLLDEAVTAYRAAIETMPSFRRAHRNIAVALVRQNALDDALPHLVEAIRLGDADGATFGLLGYCRLQRGEWASALQAYRLAQISEPDTTDWLAGIAQCLQNLNSPDEAAALLDEVIRRRPDEPSYAILRATILLDLAREAEAVASLELPHRLNTLPPNGRLMLAELHMRHGRPAAAGDRLRAAFPPAAEEQDPPAPGPDVDRLTSFIAAALHHREWGLAGEALDLVGDLPDATGNNALATLRARLLIESGDDPPAGESLLRDVLANDPTHSRALITLANHLTSRNDASSAVLEEAALLLERAASDPAAAADAHFELARLMVRQRRYQEALDAVDRSLALDPRDELNDYRAALAALVEASQ